MIKMVGQETTPSDLLHGVTIRQGAAGENSSGQLGSPLKKVQQHRGAKTLIILPCQAKVKKLLNFPLTVQLVYYPGKDWASKKPPSETDERLFEDLAQTGSGSHLELKLTQTSLLQ